jgi:hypothetical protein
VLFLDVRKNQEIVGVNVLAVAQGHARVGVGESLVGDVAEDESLGSYEVEGASLGYREGLFVARGQNLHKQM